MKIVMHKGDFPSSHLLANISKEKEYEVVDTYAKQRKIVDDIGKEVWISNTMFKKFFKEA